MRLPKPSGDFEWVQETWGPALRCMPLAFAPHCFTTRALRLEGTRDEDHLSWIALARSLGVEGDRLVRMRQVHSATVFALADGAQPPRAYDEWPEADIAVTSDTSAALSVRAADCVPILIADNRTGAVAAVHAGWKGTAAGAAIAAVRALETEYGTKCADLIAAVGPSIGPCCYEVGDELAAHFATHEGFTHWFSSGAKPRLDLWRATHDQLQTAGVPVAHIHVCRLCTSDHPAEFHSYRRDGARAGRLVAAIRSGRGTTP